MHRRGSPLARSWRKLRMHNDRRTLGGKILFFQLWALFLEGSDTSFHQGAARKTEENVSSEDEPRGKAGLL